MNKKNLLLAVLFSSVFAIGGLTRSTFTKAVASDYEDSYNRFYYFGSDSVYYNPSDDGFIFGYDEFENPYYISFLVGTVDEEFDSISYPYVNAFISYDAREYLMFRSRLTLPGGKFMTSEEFYNIRDFTLYFHINPPINRLSVILVGSRLFDNVLIPFNIVTNFNWLSPNDSSTNSLSIPSVLFYDYTFKVFNNVNISDFSEAYDFGYSDGYNKGVSDGYSDGYDKGVENTNLSNNLIGNVIFTTIGSIASFFVTISQFEVMGISIGSIISLVVSVGLVILILGFIRR